MLYVLERSSSSTSISKSVFERGERAVAAAAVYECWCVWIVQGARATRNSSSSAAVLFLQQEQEMVIRHFARNNVSISHTISIPTKYFVARRFNRNGYTIIHTMYQPVLL